MVVMAGGIGRSVTSGVLIRPAQPAITAAFHGACDGLFHARC
jgi:hypothetical protein